ncbi:MAG TPA: methyl-accepting chemotaxis protein, partial [Caulobacter sp.]|nr:methyl-accepting chemotaxis protein [Caulobacter sp.]
MKFDDLKISTKVALPAVILTMVALAITGVGAWQARVAEAATKVIVEQRAPSELEGARFNRRIALIGYAAYRTTAYDAASPEAKQASADIDTAYKEGKVALDRIKRTDPADAKLLNDFGVRMDRIYSSARQGADLGLQNANDAAKMVMGVIDPDIASLGKDVATYTNGHADETRAMVAKAADQARAGTLMTIAFGLIASAAALVFALWIGRSKIAAPLTGVARTMDVLAQGSVDVEVVGAQRKDEVGAMARSVQVFKDNAVALRTAEAAQ